MWSSPSPTTLYGVPLSATMFTRRGETLADGHAFAQGEAIMMTCFLQTISFRMLDSVTSVLHRICPFTTGQVLACADGLRLNRRIVDLRNAARSRYGFSRSDGV